MIDGELELTNRMGLHARAAARVVHLLKSYRSEVWFFRSADNVRVDARSIVCLIGMGAACGTRLHYGISGPDENETYNALKSLFESGFGELS